MFQIIGYIMFIIMTAGACICAAVLGTITGIKQNELTEDIKK